MLAWERWTLTHSSGWAAGLVLVLALALVLVLALALVLVLVLALVDGLAAMRASRAAVAWDDAEAEVVPEDEIEADGEVVG